MSADLGHLILVLALVSAVYATFASLYGGYTKNSAMVYSGQRAVIAVFIFVTLAVVGVEINLLKNDFNFHYVASYSSIALPLFYKLTTIWAGQAGSLLFWAWILTIYSMLVLYFYRKDYNHEMPYVMGILMSVIIFFAAMVVFAANPFELLAHAPADGRGLNPLLQHPAMAIHPPILYLGYVGFAVPFAFGLGALMSHRLDNRWVKTVRRWTVVPWLFLIIGIMLGGKWAYEELGWGGYWAWDPVENAAFMPWLTGTAFLHSIMIQEKKDILKVWNMVLIILTFTLSIFGTFLTRSGVVSSVHSFTASSIGPLFFAYVCLVLIVSLGIMFFNFDQLKSKTRIESLVSRESSFLINNVIFVGLCFAVFWGTVFPVISEAVRGIKISVGPPWFNTVNTPIFLALLLLTGVGPLIAWRKSSTHYLKRIFLKPTIIGIVTAVVLVAFGITKPYAVISFSLCAFVTATIIAEFHRGARARMKSNSEGYFLAMLHLLQRNKRRYGGYVVHFAVVLIFFGITGSAFDTDIKLNLKQGESREIGRFEIVYTGFESSRDDHNEVLAANVVLKVDGKNITTLHPSRHYYFVSEQPTTEVSVYYTFMEDFYIVLNNVDHEANSASFEVWVKPLVIWVWIGGLILTIGTLIALLPNTKETELRSVRKKQAAEEELVAS
ncbi:MAG: heme lyase CcmF/NrfE family subunit [Calditrichaeota bacterium]|nr:MAG: heme lyase CcmF/NrfE family subunit [Calditrichota bacterium]